MYSSFGEDVDPYPAFANLPPEVERLRPLTQNDARSEACQLIRVRLSNILGPPPPPVGCNTHPWGFPGIPRPGLGSRETTWHLFGAWMQPVSNFVPARNSHSILILLFDQCCFDRRGVFHRHAGPIAPKLHRLLLFSDPVLLPLLVKRDGPAALKRKLEQDCEMTTEERVRYTMAVEYMKAPSRRSLADELEAMHLDNPVSSLDVSRHQQLYSPFVNYTPDQFSQSRNIPSSSGQGSSTILSPTALRPLQPIEWDLDLYNGTPEVSTVADPSLVPPVPVTDTDWFSGAGLLGSLSPVAFVNVIAWTVSSWSHSVILTYDITTPIDSVPRSCIPSGCATEHTPHWQTLHSLLRSLRSLRPQDGPFQNLELGGGGHCYEKDWWSMDKTQMGGSH